MAIRFFDTEEDLKAAFNIFDTDKNGSLSRDEMRSAVMTIYRERRALDRSLRGFSQSLGKLDTFFYVITGLATLIVVLPVWGIPLTAILPFVSLLIALSFIFGGSVKSMFDSLIFIFVFHPYDTGEVFIFFQCCDALQ